MSQYPTNVLCYLEAACRSTPEQTALSDQNHAITYAQLLTRCCSIGRSLSTLLNSARNRPVFVAISRNIESVAAFYGVVCSGNFYVPVDLTLPRSRLEAMADTVRPAAVLLQQEDPELFPGIPHVIAGDIEPDASACAWAAAHRAAALDTDPLYCIFTSGSTGVPKGVLVSHRSVIDMVEAFQKAFCFPADTVFGNQAPFDFDVSVKDLYLALRCGGSVHVLDKRLFMLPKNLIEELNLHRVNTLIWAASAMKILSALKTFTKIVPAHLRTVMFSGEALPCKVLNDWRAHMPQVRYVNLYGPTEITCNCSYYPIDRPFRDEEAIPIGRPFSNTEILLLDGDRLITEPGRIGELCVRGSCLALGYYRNPEKTAQVFCQDPTEDGFPQRIYRTGDLAYWNEEGLLMFAGRADSQVKHMGHRIEMGEIEVAANAIAFVDLACCLFDGEKDRLILFYSAREQDDKAVFAALKTRLPAYMVPNGLRYLKDMPAGRTGKIDRNALKTLMNKKEK